MSTQNFNHVPVDRDANQSSRGIGSQGMERRRVELVLSRLGLLTDERLETVCALLDTESPSRFRRLAQAGKRFSDGATTRHLLDYIAPLLGKQRMDRELRDYIMLPLREVGILIKGYADTSSGEVILNKWEPKSPNNVYVASPDFKELLKIEDNLQFEDALRNWESGLDERVNRIASAEAAALAANRRERLVSIALAIYCPQYLHDYRVVFVDDADGIRIAEEWTETVAELQLPLDLTGRWPDIILNIPGLNRCWVIDCVETDGEIDPVRRTEIESAFGDRDLLIDGFTTIYRTTRRFAERQSRVDNIAPGTYVWIAEIGGSQFLKEAVSNFAEGG